MCLSVDLLQSRLICQCNQRETLLINIHVQIIQKDHAACGANFVDVNFQDQTRICKNLWMTFFTTSNSAIKTHKSGHLDTQVWTFGHTSSDYSINTPHSTSIAISWLQPPYMCDYFCVVPTPFTKYNDKYNSLGFKSQS